MNKQSKFRGQRVRRVVRVDYRRAKIPAVVWPEDEGALPAAWEREVLVAPIPAVVWPEDEGALPAAWEREVLVAPVSARRATAAHAGGGRVRLNFG